MRVSLKHGKNPDIPFGYWSDVKRDSEKLVKVADFAEASRKCLEYIMSNSLGAGNWCGGDIFDEENRRVARVSYNGKVWGCEPWTPESEPLYNPYENGQINWTTTKGRKV